MQRLTLKNFKGLNTRSKSIDKNSEYAEDLQNVRLGPTRDIEKRSGFTQEVAGEGDSLALIEAREIGELIAFKADGPYKISGSTATKVPVGSTAPASYSDKIDWAEYSKILYVTDTALNNELWKYDGVNYYKAGMRKFIANQSADSGSLDITPDSTFGAVTSLIFNDPLPTGGATNVKYTNGTSVDQHITFSWASTTTDHDYIVTVGSLNVGPNVTSSSGSGVVIKPGETVQVRDRGSTDPGTISFSGTISSPAKTYLFQYGAVDAENHIVYGDYDTVDAALGDIANINQDPGDGYKKKYATNPSVVGLFTPGDATLTLEVQNTNHNLVVNDSVAVIVRRPLGDGFFTGTPISLTVSSITVDTPIAGTDTIVLDSTSIASDDILELRSGLFSIFLRYFIADEVGALTGFRLVGLQPLNQAGADLSLMLTDAGLTGAEFPTPFEDIYDALKVFREPPIAKFISVFQNQLVLGNSKSEVVFDSDDSQNIWWSALEIGGGPESFADSNFETIGKTSEGPITGLFADEDRVTVFKTRQVYGIAGVLQNLNYVVRSLLTNGIGCVSHESIQEYQGGCFFMSSRGLHYTTRGQTPVELSDIIEPTVKDSDLDLTSAKVINEIQNERFLWWVNGTTTDKVFVYDYYYKEWFVYTGYDASGGFAYFGDEIYHADGTDIFRENAAYADNGEPIEAFYRIAFSDFGEPTIRKKYLGVTITDLSYSEWEATLEPYYDWKVPSEPTASATIEFDGTFVDDDYRLPNQANKSFSIKVKNAELNEPLNISSIQIETSIKETRSKGVK